jgi:hypothetical protein
LGVLLDDPEAVLLALTGTTEPPCIRSEGTVNGPNGNERTVPAVGREGRVATVTVLPAAFSTIMSKTDATTVDTGGGGWAAPAGCRSSRSFEELASSSSTSLDLEPEGSWRPTRPYL